MEEVIIIGGGIAGYTAAVYTARANLKPLVLTGYEEGGQLMLTTEVENFPGFPEGVMGPELMQHVRKQCERFGARIEQRFVEKVERREDNSFLITAGDQTFEGKSVIVASGASARWLNLESEKAYKGRGVTTCATCDGAFYKGKEVFVVGGGDSACEEATFLTKFATKVTIIHRRDALRASKIMQKRVFDHPKVDVMWDSVITEFLGDGKKLSGVKIKNVKSSEEKEHPIDGVFIAIGHIPNTIFVKDLCELDEHGFLKADRYMHTSLPGLFAAGDVQDTKFKQAITAAGSGCMAAMEAEKYLEGLND